MRISRGMSAFSRPLSGTYVTIGNFDGVHRGHQLILDSLVEEARAHRAESVVITFDPPPARVLGKAHTPQITTLEDKEALIAERGIDHFICWPFTLELARMPREDFVEKILVEHLNPAGIFVGYDFCFGKDRAGNVDYLKDVFEPRGCRVRRFDALVSADEPEEAPSDSEATVRTAIISSSRIRGLLSAGKVRGAARLLGRNYHLGGRVGHGDARGRRIGFPTANLDTPNELIPALGVYACVVEIAGARWPSVTNIGRRPTFDGGATRIETHLIGFDGDLYGEFIRLYFVRRIRGERRFPNVAALQTQIAEDIRRAMLIAGESACNDALCGGGGRR